MHVIKEKILEIIIQGFKDKFDNTNNIKEESLLGIFMNYLEYINSIDNKEDSLSSYIYFLMTNNTTFEGFSQDFHKGFRQRDILDSHNLDLIFWHGLNNKIINNYFWQLSKFIFDIIKENKYPEDNKYYIKKILKDFSFEK